MDGIENQPIIVVRKHLTHRERFQRRQQMSQMIKEGKSIAEVARIFGVSMNLVGNACRENDTSVMTVRPETNKKYELLAEAIKSGKTKAEVRMMYGVTDQTIKIACYRCNVSYPREYGSRGLVIVTPEQWQQVDWKRRDSELAKGLGVSRERVRQVRNKLNKPKSEFHCFHNTFMRFREWALPLRDKLNGLRVADVQNLYPYPVNRLTLNIFCKRLGITLASKIRAKELTKENLRNYVNIVQFKEGMTECWQWSIKRDYSLIGGEPGHHFVYKMFYGSIPTGKWIIFKCGNKKCVNPSHLMAGDPIDAMRIREENNPDWNIKRLTDEQVEAIRNEYNINKTRARPVTIQNLADKYNVSVMTIWYIVSGQSHKTPSAERISPVAAKIIEILPKLPEQFTTKDVETLLPNVDKYELIAKVYSLSKRKYKAPIKCLVHAGGLNKGLNIYTKAITETLKEPETLNLQIEAK